MLVLNKIGQKFQSEDKKRLLENFFSLSVLQGANYILPLITLPYLVRVLGPEKFGLIAFAQSFIQYFNILTDYGFNLSATREISIHRDNKEKISEIFSSVMITKFGLMIISLVILSLLVFTIPKFKNDWLVYFFTFGMVLGNVLFPIWFFQGMERMKYITILNIVAKGIFTICIFIFIKKMADYLYVPLINSMGFLVAGGLSLRIVSKDFGIKFILPSFKAIKYQLKEGWYIFMSTLSYNLYNNSPKFFIGLFMNNASVAFYSVAEKIINALRQVINIIFQVFYPYLAKMCKKDFKTYARAWFKLFKFSSCISILLFIFIFFLPQKIFTLIFSENFLFSLPMLKILALSLPLQVLMNLFGMQSMLLLGFTRAYGISYAVFSTLFLLILPLILWLTKSIYLTIALILFTEFMIVVYRIFYLHKRRILYALFGHSIHN